MPESLLKNSGINFAVESDMPSQAQVPYPGQQRLKSFSYPVGSQGKSEWSGAGHLQLSTRVRSQGQARIRLEGGRDGDITKGRKWAASASEIAGSKGRLPSFSGQATGSGERRRVDCFPPLPQLP